MSPPFLTIRHLMLPQPKIGTSYQTMSQTSITLRCQMMSQLKKNNAPPDEVTTIKSNTSANDVSAQYSKTQSNDATTQKTNMSPTNVQTQK